ncbi:hypothetical protein GCM10023340_12550 [Nocardioides marinquilinus]|uniref:Type II secretion system protein GspE N-terminal domain-containing protein n=1 Tax=Nocardioides marinquilinus TaxID=1210400 RepID=A0ABP9PF05_9ACTN
MTAAALNLPRLSDGVDDELSHAVPEPVCRAFGVVPYGERSGRVLVAVVDDDPVTEHVVADGLDRPVTLVRHDVDEIVETIDRTFAPPASTGTSAPRPAAPASADDSAGAADPADPGDDARLARLLSEAGLVEPGPLRRGLVEHARTGDPLADVLAAHGAVPEPVLLDALSELHQLHRVDLAGFEPDPAVARRLPAPLAVALGVLPLAEDAGAVLLAVTRPLADDDLRRVEAELGQACRPLLADRLALDALVQSVHGPAWAQAAGHALDEVAPQWSARTLLSPGQRAVLVLALGAVAVSAAVWPLPTLAGLLAATVLAYLVVAGYRVRLALRVLGGAPSVVPAVAPPVDDRDLPCWSVLVPLTDGAAGLPGLQCAVDSLDHPRTRLDVLLLCPADDTATVAWVRGLALPPPYRLVVVPAGASALAHGLHAARGELGVVLDPGARPDPDQLRRAAAFLALHDGDDGVVGVRPRVVADAAEGGLLARWTAVESAVLGAVVAPPLESDRAALPLAAGPTHLRLDAVRAAGGWSPHHRTPGAELAVRLHRLGRRTLPLDSTTHVTAAVDAPAWVRHRARLVAGTLQTWLAHARHPARLVRDLGLRGAVAFHLTAGQVLVPLLNPLLWALVTLLVVTRDPLVDGVLGAPVVYAGGALVVLAQVALVLVGVVGCLQRGQFHLARAALLAPWAWGLTSLAAWRGALSLLRRPGRGGAEA